MSNKCDCKDDFTHNMKMCERKIERCICNSEDGFRKDCNADYHMFITEMENAFTPEGFQLLQFVSVDDLENIGGEDNE